jgi:hypothetical protein
VGFGREREEAPKFNMTGCCCPGELQKAGISATFRTEVVVPSCVLHQLLQTDESEAAKNSLIARSRPAVAAYRDSGADLPAATVRSVRSEIRLRTCNLSDSGVIGILDNIPFI